jgi:hypothetical protein
MSERVDGWSPARFRRSDTEIEAGIDGSAPPARADIAACGRGPSPVISAPRCTPSRWRCARALAAAAGTSR